MSPANTSLVNNMEQGVLLRTRFFVLDWTLRYSHTIVTVDGEANELDWGEHFISLDTGAHTLEVAYRFIGHARGRSSIRIEVAPNHIVRVCYQAPRSVLFSFLPGKLVVETGNP